MKATDPRFRPDLANLSCNLCGEVFQSPAVNAPAGELDQLAQQEFYALDKAAYEDAHKHSLGHSVDDHIAATVERVASGQLRFGFSKCAQCGQAVSGDPALTKAHAATCQGGQR